MNIFDFLNNHPFVAWCALWLLWPVVRLPLATLKTIRILVRGWPPAHIDVDGEFKKEEKS